MPVLLTLVAIAIGLMQPAPLRVLFIGNSLTYANDLPAIVSAIGQAEGHPITCDVVASPDFSLEDHWQRGEARAAIARGGWTTVVLQQGPSALMESRALLVEYTRRFDREIRKSGASTALYMVWPSQQRRGDFAGTSASYGAAARAVGGRLLPVGDAWREAWRLDRRLALYGPDGFHPSPLGSALAGLVIFQGLTGRHARGLPANVHATVQETEVLLKAAGAVDGRQPVFVKFSLPVRTILDPVPLGP
jgi:hypothetical protein